MASPDEIDLAESQVATLIDVCHRSGLNYWEIMDIFLKATCDLHLKASAEYQIKEVLCKSTGARS